MLNFDQSTVATGILANKAAECLLYIKHLSVGVLESVSNAEKSVSNHVF